ncbi:MAG: tRNA epoxyqueuosine(34) reductase QueG [Verrucomicrobiota bacterium]
MKQAISLKARELGFDACGFTNAEPPEYAAQFQNWIAEDRHGEMAYLQRNAAKRTQPQLVLDQAKTIISLAISYTPSDDASASHSARDDAPNVAHETTRPAPTTDRGVVARYARYSDYHDVLGDRLKSLTAFVNELDPPATHSLWYVDTGPILERDFAQRSGVGFIGKHTNLISRHLGNWIFLSEIITTLELAPDAAEKNRCGSCARCIAACPTNAITAPFQLDARRCISYLTIELKGSIPVELRPAIGNRIYGCDDCLAVCPWNRFARKGQIMQAHAKPELAAPDLIELLALDEASFRKRFAGTPLLRAKRRGLLRNVCVALGNIGGAPALPSLQRAATNSEPLIAEHARWAVEQIENRVRGQKPPPLFDQK